MMEIRIKAGHQMFSEAVRNQHRHISTSFRLCANELARKAAEIWGPNPEFYPDYVRRQLAGWRRMAAYHLVLADDASRGSE